MKEKILVIDDDPDIVEILLMRLEASGYEVHTAADGKEGLLRLKVTKPDLIIVDVMMPTMDGFSFVQEIKKEGFGHIPVIVLTAKGMMGKVFEMEGVKEYLLKPFDAQQLLDMIKKYI